MQSEKDLDTLALQKAQIDQENLEREHQQRMVTLARQAQIQERGLFGSTLQTLESTWSGGLQKLVQGTLSFGNALRGIWQSISSAFVGLVSQIVVKWAFGEAAKTAATLFHSSTRTSIEAGAAVESQAISSGFALKDIAIKGYQAAAGAYAAIASIPYVGPFLAPVVAAGALAAVVGFGAKIASAEGGYDIPAGVNPITQLHEKEMVLPRAQADVVRSLAEGGGAGGGDAHFHFHGPADAKSFQRWLADNPGTLAPALRNLRRNFAPT